ncbi:DNA/RNA non-specific endonuclease [Scytonema sp. UIC 10036]|uniref:DNA/RNA non-specific endonuclease n=1 Tax=Scytonema sp. UIC 10036 TaxID=2304196 RepID=UPI0012DA77D8|nr:DNA/RNA non-specific endonuclease [Scytonema sp. UIC 10036]MUG91066.1 DNA/RNA non-specific endonuclease [Scytonema sp. UIC 10036]
MFASKKFLILLITLLLTLTVGCTILFPKQVATNPHLAFGNPSNASKTDPNNYLIEKPQYVLSYNRDKGIPNWVSWELNQSWLGEAPRSNNFRPDDTLPEGWYHVAPNDYTKSGFDKGHMVPSADRSNNPENNAATFLMTNIIPQAPDNNQGYWARLEDYERTLANQGNELHIISGVYGEKGTIAQGKVSIPARIFKIIVVTPPNESVNSINEFTRIIAVDTPNINGNRDADWTEFLTSVDAIEKETGYDFLSHVNPSTQNIVESKIAQVTDLKLKSRTRKK